jgi:hypothetical protein
MEEPPFRGPAARIYFYREWDKTPKNRVFINAGAETAGVLSSRVIRLRNWARGGLFYFFYMPEKKVYETSLFGIPEESVPGGGFI